MFSMEMLPALHGDALWIEYGDIGAPHCVLIDGGPRSKRTAQALRSRLVDRVIDGAGDLELLIVTHIDADHIAGILRILQAPDLLIEPGDVWFNAWQHLPTDVLGAKQGEALSAQLTQRRLPWNTAFGGEAVATSDRGPLPVVVLPGGLKLTVLSPGRLQLAQLRPVWKAEVEKAGLVPGFGVEEAEAQPDVLGDDRLDPEALAAEPFVEDGSEANGASIALLAEFDGRALLLTGDAHGGVLADGLGRLVAERNTDRLRIDAFKLPHHGSRFNLSPEVLALVDCGRYLFSTNGNIFHHPDTIAVSRVVVEASERSLEFNYRTEFTERWDSSRIRRRFAYSTVFPDDGEDGLLVEL